MKYELNFKSLVLITNQLPFCTFYEFIWIYCENLKLQNFQGNLIMDTTIEILDLK